MNQLTCKEADDETGNGSGEDGKRTVPHVRYLVEIQIARDFTEDNNTTVTVTTGSVNRQHSQQ